MTEILTQLGVDSTFFVQLGLFLVFFAVIRRVFFDPFLKLFEARHQRTVRDREAAEKLLQQAQFKFEEHERLLQEARQEAKAEFQANLNRAKAEEAELTAKAREEAKRVTQEALVLANQEREKLRKDLEKDVEVLADRIAEKLLLNRA